MKVQISYKIINPSYDKNYADEYHFGKESENNERYNYTTSYEIDGVESVELIDDGVFQLKGKLANGREIDLSIRNVFIFRFHFNDKTYVDYAASKSIVNKTHKIPNKKYNITRYYFYINSEPASVAITKNLFLNINEIPEVLRKN